MKTGYISSSMRKKCKICGKLTSDYRTFHQTEMTLEVPMCEEHWKNQELILANIEFRTEIFLKEVNKFFK